MARSSIRSDRWLAAGVMLFGAATGEPALAQNTLPTGGHVVAGSATIGAPNGNSLTINQNASRAVINWNSFSVGQPNAVTFAQPGASAAILNRVTGATSSTIAGQVNANGQVYLVNPNGIAITPSGSVRVGGGFVASTLGIANGDFMSGNLAFTGNGASAGVSNAGRISVGSGGYAALIGGTAANSGVISVPLGKVALGSAERATLDLNGDGFMQVAAPTGATTAKGQALVSNSGRIEAAGGSVQLQAATVASAIRNAVNMSGVIAANSVSGHDGAITLGGGPGGAVAVAGTLDAAGSSASGANGGRIAVDGARVKVGHHAVLDASGAKGGTVLVGVSAPGGVDEAARTTIASGAQILARGTSVASSGGYIETSGGRLKLGNATIDAGRGGTWLTDPSNLTIDAAAATTINTALAAGTNVIEQTTATGTSGAGIISTGNGDIDVASALAWNSSATLTLSAFNNITVGAPITISGGGTLVLTYNNNQGGINTGGALSFVMGQGSATFTSQASNPALFINNGTPGSGNGTQYTLIYNTGATATGIQSLNGSPGNFALAVPLDTTSLGTLTAALIPSFSGNFNGLGNTITGLTINSAVPNANVGLFGINSGAVIANLGLTCCSVTGAANANVGGLVGLNQGTVFNSYAVASVNGGANTGGLVGFNNAGAISQSYATGAVSGGAISAGGLVGEQNSGAIGNSFATGSVSGGLAAGGLVGIVTGGGTVTSSFATGAVAGGPNTGGLIGQNNGTITTSYWDTSSSGNLIGVGFGSSAGVTGKTTAQLSAGLPAGFSASVWSNLNNQVTPYIATNPGPVFGGSDTVLSTLVFTPTQLQAIGTNATTLAGHYILAQDIDATGFAGFLPIGNNLTPFSGVFNGLGSVIADLVITKDNNTSVGVFGLSSGTIENVGVVGGSVTTPNTSVPNTGGLLGYNAGSVINSYSTVPVIGLNNTGGLVGVNNTGGRISDSYATGAVSELAPGNHIGGLVGVNQNAAISNSYATGSVTGRPGSFIGGLAGENTGTGTMTNVYASGAVSGGAGSSVGGLVGVNGNTITSGYWNSDRSPAGTLGVGSGSSAGVTALSGTAPFTATSFTGFTFTTTPNTTPGSTPNRWVLVDADGSLNNAGGAAGATMPMLAAEYSTTIHNVHQLQLMTMNSAGSYTLGRNIDATATGSSTGPTTGTDVWTSAGFVPILNLTGTFSGLSSTGAVQTIANLTIKDIVSIDVGLIGVSSGSISNVGLIGGSVSGATVPTINGGTAVGALVGFNEGGISNSYATAAVSVVGNQNGAGGLVGTNFTGGTISNSYATGTVTAGNQSAVGGLVGENAGGTVGNSYATGTVTGGGQSGVGGLVGANSSGGAVSNSYATGTVTGGDQSQVGGLVGVNDSGAIANSYATGTVTGGGNLATIGGLVGNNGGTISNSYANGAVTSGAGSLVGGLAGDNTGTISTSFAAGKVSGSNGDEGGLLGENAGTITDVYAVGAVIGTNATVGGLVGINTQTGTITDAYATGALIISGGHAHGLVGTNVGTITDGYYDAGTTGQALGTQADNSTGLTTAQLQGTPGVIGAFDLATDFQNPSNWGIVAGKSYPYLCWQFGGCGGGTTPQVVAGIDYTNAAGTTPAGGNVAVTGLVNGAALISAQTGGNIVTTGANGYYYYLLAPNTIPATNGNVLTSVAGATAGAALADQSDGYPTNLAIYANTLHVMAPTAVTKYSTVVSDTATAYGATPPTFTNLWIDAAAPFNIDAVISYPTGVVTLNMASTVSVTGSSQIIANTLTGNSVGGATFFTQVSNFGPFTNTGGEMIFDDTSAVALIGNISSTSLVFGVNSTITQTAGVITASTMIGGAEGAAAFDDANQVSTLGPFAIDAAGDLSFVNATALTTQNLRAVAGNLSLRTESGNLTLTEFGGVIAADAAGHTVTLNSGGAIDASNATISAATLTGSSSSGALLTGSNTIANFGPFTNSGSGGIALVDNSPLTIAGALATNNAPISITTTGASNGITISNPIQAIGGTLTLVSAGTIVETGAGSISAATLTGSSSGAATLIPGVGLSNQITTFGPFTKTGTGALILNDSASSLTLSGAITAPGQTVDFIYGVIGSSGTISQAAGSVITTATLVGSQYAGSLNGGNLVGTLNWISGNGSFSDFSFTNAQALTVTNVGSNTGATGTTTLTTTGAGNGITVTGLLSGATTIVNAAGALTIASGAAVGGGSSTIDLTATSIALNGTATLGVAGATIDLAHSGTVGDITEGAGATISAGTLSATNAVSGTVNLVGTNNAIATLGAFNLTTPGSAFTLVDNSPLTISGAVSTASGNIVLQTNSGGMTLSGDITATGHLVTLVSSGSIQQTAGVITAQGLTGSSVGGATLTDSNQLATFALFSNATSGPISLTNARSLTIAGLIIDSAGGITLTTTGAGSNLTLNAGLTAAGNTVTLNSAGTITQPSGVITAATVTGSSVGGASMPSGNNVAIFGPWSDTGAGSTGILFTSGVTLTTAGAISSASGGVTLSAITEPDLILNSDVSGSTVTLLADGNINQTAGGIIATNLHASTQLDAGGLITLNSATNAVTGNVTLTSINTAGTAIAGGAIGFTDSAGFSIAVAAAGGIGGLETGVRTTGGVSLSSGGAITELGVVTAATLTGSSVGGAILGNANSIGTLGPWSDTGAGSTGFTFDNVKTLTTTGALSSASGPIALALPLAGSNLILGGDVTASGNTVTLTAGGSISQTSGAITATNLIAFTKLDAGAPITLNSATNAVPSNVTLASLNAAGTALASGAIGFTDASGLTIASFGVEPGIATTGAATILAGGNLTIAAGASVTGSNIALSTPGSFINNQGAGAVTATGGGRWLIYSNAPAGDIFSNLDSGNTAIWGATFATLPPASVAVAGNRYLFAQTQTLTVTTTDVSKTFGQDATAAVAAAFTETGFAPGVANAFLADSAANVVSGTPSVTSTGAPATASVAGSPYPIIATTGSLTMASGYNLAFANTGVLTVTPVGLTLTVTASNQSKTYGQTLSLGTTAFTTSGLVNGDSVSGVTLTSAGAAATAPVASYAIIPSNAVGSGLSNYTITYVNGALTVTPAALTVTASNQSKTYGQILSLGTTAFTTSGLVNGDSVSGVTLASAGAAATANVVGSPYAITASSAAGSGLGNYTITYVNGALGVTPATLTASIIGNPTKVYDGTTNATLTSANYSLTGFVSGQGASVTQPAGSYVSANAGSGVAVTANLAASNVTANVGTLLSNYILPTSAAGIGTITPATLTAGLAGAVGKVYDGTATATLAAANYTLSGVVSGDAVSLNNPVSGIYASPNVGNAIGVSVTGLALTGTSAGNYTLANPSSSAAIGSITPAALIASITGNPSKVYDGTATAALASGNLTLAGFAAGQGATASPISGSYATANAGAGIGVSATLTAGNFTANPGTLFSNYTLPTNAAGAGTITPAVLTVSIIGNPSKVYDGTTTAALAAGNLTLSGFIAGQGATVLPLSGSYAAANAGAGIGVSATLTAANLTANSGTLLGNYTLPITAMGTGTITAKALTISADNLTKIYGNSLSFAGTEFSVNGLVANDAITAVSLASAGAAATAGVGGSSYPVTASAAAGAGVSNYAITYLPGTLTVTPRPITATANNLSRPSSQPNPPLTFAVTAGNLVNGDALSGALATIADNSSLAGSYPITQGTLAAMSNYALTFVNGTLVVTSTPELTVTRDFGVSPNRFLPPVSELEPPLSGLTPCSPGDLVSMFERSGRVVLFGAQRWTCSNL